MCQCLVLAKVQVAHRISSEKEGLTASWTRELTFVFYHKYLEAQ